MKPDQQTIDEFVGAAHGDFDTVNRLLAQYPDILNLPASWGEHAIQAAAQTGRAEIAERLLAAGAPLDICTAAMLGNATQVKAFLARDSSLAHATGAHNLPVLYHAAVRGQIPIAEILIQHGTHVNAGEGKNTALHGAVFFGQIEMVKWLVAHGANVNALDHEGRTPHALAIKAGQTEIAGLLE
ncbi:MAG: ankyrin repeat domain-containing protein [Chloroflexi bacterium]|nr:ankyrin repeat domain-containing protein [Chloroflexota bacterium]